MEKINPFQPHMPVHPEMFVGRSREVKHLRDSLIQTRAGNPCGFMVTGERGIGKSSLLAFVKSLAEGKEPLAHEHGERLKFLVVQTDIDQTTTQFGLVKKIELGFQQATQANEKVLGFLQRTWDVLGRVEAGGVKFRDRHEETPTETIIEECSYSLASTVNTLSSSRALTELGLGSVYDGVLLLIDEADNASPGLQLGSFLKLLIERIGRNECYKFIVGLAGLPRLRDGLAETHPSSPRLFEELELEPLCREDTKCVIARGLLRANRVNQKETTIAPEAEELIFALSEGFPHFIQQYCFSAFLEDDDWKISFTDVLKSALGKGGAVEIIGNSYYRTPFYNKIKQESHREVLRIMASKSSVWVTKKEICHEMKDKSKTVDDAIHALLNAPIIVPKEGTHGVFRLPSKGFSLWIRFFTKDPAVRVVPLSGASLGKFDLSATPLYMADLRGANLMGTNLAWSDLRKADLAGADLTDADLSDADLRGADLSGTLLGEADLLKSDLRGVDLREAKGLSREQINSAKTDAATQLPGYLLGE